MGGNSGKSFIGLYFSEENSTAVRHLKFLRFDLIFFPNNEDGDIPYQQIWFQQDGALPSPLWCRYLLMTKHPRHDNEDSFAYEITLKKCTIH
ncbi:hypothetical protein NQ315_012845 [Exocentrus adspersus]|uniref:Uncharacterized protein n=1 Tax=Exocentrus adspersus TaxID=1586481 RepID=A0AAV8VDG9_9CUCU|nr:hypothetical protein NQ315_012845 [Exocentrus adspersus]